MLKKLFLLIITVILAGCNTLSRKDDLSNFFTIPKVKKDNKNLQENNKIYPLHFNRKVGFINVNGDEVFPPVFDLYSQNEEFFLCGIKNDDKVDYSIIMKNGEKIDFNPGDANFMPDVAFNSSAKTGYSFISVDDKNFAFLDYEKGELFNVPNKIGSKDLHVTICDKNTFIAYDYSSEKNFLVDISGEILLEKNYQIYSVADENDNVHYLCNPTVVDSPYTVIIDRNGNALFTFPVNETVFTITDENIVTYIYEEEKLSLFFYDKYYNKLNSSDFDGGFLNNIYEDRYIIVNDKDNNCHVFDMKGNEIISFEQKSLFFNIGKNQTIVVVQGLDNRIDNSAQIYDINFKLIKDLNFLPKEYSFVSVSEHFCVVSKNNEVGVYKYGIIDSQNSALDNLVWLVEPEYDNMYTFYDEDKISNYISTYKNRSSNIYDTEAKKFVFQSDYLSSNLISDKLFRVETPYFVGVTNEKGEYIYAMPARTVNDE